MWQTLLGMIRLGFARDTFVNGGDLVDSAYWFAGRDKVQHVICELLGVLLLQRFLGALLALCVGILAGLAVEVVEHVRYYRLVTLATQPQPTPPLFCDRFSWRDLVADLVGALGGIILGVVLR